ncbi:MAG: peptidoglycan DD-metalloendopeptidase family protein [Azospira sp.]|jgi:lipoprotein NlpD|nr:peptidoglycan DD-metalloendopeptidase family protein [Azospira sp.]
MKHRLALTLSVLLAAGCASKVPAPVVERGTSAVPPAATAAARDLYTVKAGDTLHGIAREHGIDHRDLIAWNRIENPNHIRVGMQLRVRPPAAAAGTAVAQPIGGAGAAVEQRVLDGATPAAAAAPSLLKTEPKAGKLPYSEETLAQARQSTEAPSPAAAPAVPPTASAAPAAAEPRPESAPSAAAAATGPDGVPWIWPAAGNLISRFSDSGSKGIGIGGHAGDPVLAAGEGRVVYSGTGLRGYGKLVIVKHNDTYLSAYAHNRNLLVKEGQAVSRGQKIAEMGDTDAEQVKLHFEIRRQGKPVDPLRYLPPR